MEDGCHGGQRPHGSTAGVPEQEFQELGELGFQGPESGLQTSQVLQVDMTLLQSRERAPHHWRVQMKTLTVTPSQVKRNVKNFPKKWPRLNRDKGGDRTFGRPTRLQALAGVGRTCSAQGSLPPTVRAVARATQGLWPGKLPGGEEGANQLGQRLELKIKAATSLSISCSNSWRLGGRQQAA